VYGKISVSFATACVFVSFLHFNKKPVEADIGYTKYVAFLSWLIIKNDNN